MPKDIKPETVEVDDVSEEELDEGNVEMNEEEQQNMLNSLKQLMSQQPNGEDGEDDDDDDDFEVEDEEQDLGDLMNTYFYDSEKNRNIVDVAVEIKRCFEKQNQILLKLATILQNKH